MPVTDSSINSRVIRHRDTIVTRWKNGLGESRLVAKSPEEGDAFDWQISLASMSGTLPFSEYPGIDRSLYVIAGDGLRVRSSIRDVVLNAHAEGLSFDGGEKIVGTVVGPGEMHDFNLLSKQGRVSHRSQRIHVSASESQHEIKDLSVIFVQSGHTVITYDGIPNSLSPGDTAIFSRSHDPMITISSVGSAICIIADISLHDRAAS